MRMKTINIYEEASRCMLCLDAPCTKACKTGDPARAIRAIRFDNHKPAMRWVKDCSDADLERAEQACVHYNWPIRIKEILRSISPDDVDDSHYPSLEITFCGIKCENPFFLASSAVCTNYEMVAKAFDAGWAGVFYKTICMQEIKEVSPRFDAMHSVATRGDFYGFRNMEQLSENPVEACIEAGADAISAINTIKSVTMVIGSDVAGQRTVSGYSGRAVRPIALRHVLELAELRNNFNSQFELSGIGGIEMWRDAVEFIQLGCNNVQVCTAVMQYGYRIIDDLILGLQRYMAKRNITRLQDLVGEQLPSFIKPDHLNRDTIIYPKIDKEKCVGCHLCRLVCPTGAIGLTKRIPKKSLGKTD